MPSGAISDPTPINGATFDYIIIGAGNAGMPLANRLSEDSSKSVLVIEAGGDVRYDDTVRIANETYGDNKKNPDHSWIYPAVMQIENTKPDVWFGKGIGGSTNVNGQVWNAPSKAQVEAIAKLGNDGWSWEDLLKYYKRAQDYHPPSAELAADPGVTYDPEVHNSGGPVTISHPNITFVPQTQSVFVKAVKTALGMDRAQDLQSGDNVGVAFVAQTIHPNSTLQRVSSATSYFTPIENSRSNLVILLKSRATKIIWDDSANGTDAKAIGVEFQQYQGGQTFTAKTRGEVILSAGAMRSPFLLELSGVGDPRRLSTIGIAPKVNLPGVGLNHIEQYQVGTGAPVLNISWHGFGASSSIAQSNAIQLFGKNVTEVESYVRSKHATWAQDQVNGGAAYNVEGIMKQYELMTDGIFSNQVPIGENFFGNGFWGPLSSLSMSMYVLTPYSRGYVHAISSNPWSDPVFNPRFFTVPFDMDMEVAHLRSARKIFNTTEMQSIMYNTTFSPLCNCTLDSAEEYGFLRSHAIQSYSTLDHSVGTCSMMPKEYGGVVNSKFMVYGTQNLRVVDASIIPMQLSAHPQATVYAIAEKAADIIKNQHTNSTQS
ncbi:alcohol oxidase [Meira miltonrushii]|uniref:Alcohol oxidase n=1 Tax=Meira miltonrushii TaxID=1280837 RepID=A0A316VKE2_9BASI|nr:alcohol oxidase [Meira miltonrushii]PWN35965.1 alcohol oxidase [Meira miltonrushii]